MRDLTRQEFEGYHARMQRQYAALGTLSKPDKPREPSEDKQKLSRDLALITSQRNLMRDYAEQCERERDELLAVLGRIKDMIETYDEPVLHTLPQPLRVEIAGLLEDVK